MKIIDELLSRLDYDERCCTELNACDLLANKGEPKRATIVGHSPFMPQSRSVEKEPGVIDPEVVLWYASHGATFRRIKEVRLLNMER